MFQGMNFAPAQLPGELEALRTEVREFLNAETDWHPNSDFNAGASPEFSKRFAAKGWIGMTWPKEYGGGGRSFLERYVVTEELLAAGATQDGEDYYRHWLRALERLTAAKGFITEPERAQRQAAAQVRARRSRRLAIRGTPRAWLDSRVSASSSISTAKMEAERRRI